MIGFLDDTPDGIDRELFERALALAFERVGEGQRFARPFELLYERVDGLPWGSAAQGDPAVYQPWALSLLFCIHCPLTPQITQSFCPSRHSSLD